MSPGRPSFARSPVMCTSRVREIATYASPHTASISCWRLTAAPGTGDEHLEKLELLGRQRHRSAADLHLTGRQIDHHVTLGDRLLGRGSGCAATLGHDVEPRQQFREARRLDEVVVRPAPQSPHHRSFVVAGGQDHHRNVADGPQLPEHLQAVRVGETEIEYHRVHTAMAEKEIGARAACAPPRGRGWPVLPRVRRRLRRRPRPPRSALLFPSISSASRPARRRRPGCPPGWSPGRAANRPKSHA